MSPFVAINESGFDMYLYYYLDDIVLRTKDPVSLWHNNRLNPVAVFQLWYVLNYDTMCTGRVISDEYRFNLCEFGFRQMVGDKPIISLMDSIELNQNPFIMGKYHDRFIIGN